jgi:hypothetical protein
MFRSNQLCPIYDTILELPKVNEKIHQNIRTASDLVRIRIEHLLNASLGQPVTAYCRQYKDNNTTPISIRDTQITRISKQLSKFVNICKINNNKNH